MISKSRPAIHESIAVMPIIWPLNLHRHYGEIHNIVKGKEVPWKNKLPKLFWRGKTNGGKKRVQLISRWVGYDQNVVDIAFNEIGGKESIKGFHRRHLQKQFERQGESVLGMSSYKYLLSLEGNDVASGLKWMLYSNSVVFMPPPKFATWAMEDLLMPFVHYIPVASDLSNLLEMIEWAKQHDEMCQQISERATEFIERLW